MKLLLTSDWHLDAVTAGVRRLGEFDAYLEAVIETIEEESIDHVFVLGDYFDPGTMRAHELTALLLEIAGRLAERPVANVVFIAGNHDVVESSEGWTTLSPLVTALKWGFCAGESARLHVMQLPGAIVLSNSADGDPSLVVLCLPYVSRAMQSKSGTGGYNVAYPMSDAAQLSEKLKVPLVVLGHLTVPGAVLGSESKEMARGRDVDLPRLAELNPALVANGHYHRCQIVKCGGVDVVIPGSPMRFTFGERDDQQKGFTVVEI